MGHAAPTFRVGSPLSSVTKFRKARAKTNGVVTPEWSASLGAVCNKSRSPIPSSDFPRSRLAPDIQCHACPRRAVLHCACAVLVLPTEGPCRPELCGRWWSGARAGRPYHDCQPPSPLPLREVTAAVLHVRPPSGRFFSSQPHFLALSIAPALRSPYSIRGCPRLRTLPIPPQPKFVASDFHARRLPFSRDPEENV